MEPRTWWARKIEIPVKWTFIIFFICVRAERYVEMLLVLLSLLSYFRWYFGLLFNTNWYFCLLLNSRRLYLIFYILGLSETNFLLGKSDFFRPVFKVFQTAQLEIFFKLFNLLFQNGGSVRISAVSDWRYRFLDSGFVNECSIANRRIYNSLYFVDTFILDTVLNRKIRVPWSTLAQTFILFLVKVWLLAVNRQCFCQGELLRLAQMWIS